MTYKKAVVSDLMGRQLVLSNWCSDKAIIPVFLLVILGTRHWFSAVLQIEIPGSCSNADASFCPRDPDLTTLEKAWASDA